MVRRWTLNPRIRVRFSTLVQNFIINYFIERNKNGID